MGLSWACPNTWRQRNIRASASSHDGSIARWASAVDGLCVATQRLWLRRLWWVRRLWWLQCLWQLQRLRGLWSLWSLQRLHCLRWLRRVRRLWRLWWVRGLWWLHQCFARRLPWLRRFPWPGTCHGLRQSCWWLRSRDGTNTCGASANGALRTQPWTMWATPQLCVHACDTAFCLSASGSVARAARQQSGIHDGWPALAAANADINPRLWGRAACASTEHAALDTPQRPSVWHHHGASLRVPHAFGT